MLYRDFQTIILIERRTGAGKKEIKLPIIMLAHSDDRIFVFIVILCREKFYKRPKIPVLKNFRHTEIDSLNHAICTNLNIDHNTIGFAIQRLLHQKAELSGSIHEADGSNLFPRTIDTDRCFSNRITISDQLNDTAIRKGVVLCKRFPFPREIVHNSIIPRVWLEHPL